MNVLSGSPRVEIRISVNPEFELRLERLSIQEDEPNAADFNGNRFEIGHAWFNIFSEVGEIRTGAVLSVEYEARLGPGQTEWKLIVQPRPVLELLAEAMGKLVMAEGGEAIRWQAIRGGSVYSSLRGGMVDSGCGGGWTGPRQ